LVVAASKKSVSSRLLSATLRSVVQRAIPCAFASCASLAYVAADQDRIGHHRVAVLERDAALRADGEDRADQMLVRAHAPADAVHDDAEPLLRHFSVALSRVPGAAKRVSA